MGNAGSTTRSGHASNGDVLPPARRPLPSTYEHHPLPGSSSTAAATSGVDRDGGRPNFPLPRELRDYLYRYLLDAEEVIAGPFINPARDGYKNCYMACARERNSTAHTYRFHTNILAVNKKIHAEATEYLHANNLFIRVTHCWPLLECIKHELHVPIITENVHRINRSTVVGLNYAIIHPGRDEPSLTKMCLPKSFLMLARDFPRFTRMMQWLFSQFDTPVTLTIRGDHDRNLKYMKLRGKPIPGVRVTMTMRPLRDDQNVKYLQDEISKIILLQSQLVMPGLHFVTNGSKELGLSASHINEYIYDCASSKHIRVEALLWGMIQILQSLKDSADELVTQGRYVVAVERLQDILNTTKRWEWLKQRPFIISNDTARSAFRVLLQIVLDCYTMSSKLYFRLRESTCAIRDIGYARQLIVILVEALPNPSPLWPTSVLDACLASQSQEVEIARLACTNLENALRIAQALFAQSQAGRPPTARSVADAAFFDRILNDDLQLNLYENCMTTKEILEEMSIGNEPVQIFNTPIPDAVLAQKPTKLSGWWIWDDYVGQQVHIDEGWTVAT